MKIAFGVEYDGSRFRGWQIQNGARTVQSCLEQALSKIANHPVSAVCAGRTDTGVHAIGQVIHIQTEAQREEWEWIRGTNSNLPDDVNIVWAKVVDGDFHARFSACSRIYRYLIFNRPVRSAVWGGRATWIYRPLDHESMRAGARWLLGRHDFSAFRAAGCQAKSPVKDITRFEINRTGHLITVEIEADAFLYHMVRNIAGVLIAVGTGERHPDWVQEVVSSKDRTHGGITAAPDGLYFMSPTYPLRYAIPRLQDFSTPW